MSFYKSIFDRFSILFVKNLIKCYNDMVSSNKILIGRNHVCKFDYKTYKFVIFFILNNFNSFRTLKCELASPNFGTGWFGLGKILLTFK